MSRAKRSSGRQLRVGVVGMGIRGRMYAAIASQLPETELVGAAEVDKAAAARAKKECIVPVYTDAAELCRAAKPDLVVVATPDFAHTEPALAAAEAGSHLLIEKPLAMSLADARRMIHAVQQTGVQAMVGFENHWNPPLTAMKAATLAGELGACVSCNAQLDDRIDVPTKMLGWLGQSSPGWFLMAHTVELAGWIAGQRPARAWAAGHKGVLSRRGLNTYDAIHAVLEFDGGMVGSFSSCWVLPRSLPLVFQFRQEVVGTRGSMRADLTDQMLHKAGARYEHPSTIGVTMGGAMTSPPARMFQDFVASLREDCPPPCPLEDGLWNVAAVEAIHRSIESGQAVDVRI